MKQDKVILKQQNIEQIYNSRFRKTDVQLAMNKLKVKSIKTLKDGLLTGKKSHEMRCKHSLAVRL